MIGMDTPGFYNHAVEEMRSREFPTLAGLTYLDHAGATLYAKSQIGAVQQDLASHLYGNPHSSSASSRLCTDTIDQTRFRILRFFNASPETHTVIFTSGCTGALKLVAEAFSFSKPEPLSQTTDPRGHASASQAAADRSAAGPAGHSESPATTSPTAARSQRPFVQRSGKVADAVPAAESRQKTFKAKSSEVVQLQQGQDEREKKGCFCYLQDNHTSAQGMRELAAGGCGAILCLTEPEVHGGLTDQSLVWGTLQSAASGGNSLFVFPGQSNFSGRKYPLEWVAQAQKGALPFQCGLPGKWFVVLDAASLVSTSPLDLSDVRPDFVTLSFYKMFGFPTGLGALLVRNSSAWVLEKRYFGGGTVAASAARERFCVLRANLSDRFEDGTLPYLDIVALTHGFKTLENLAGGMDKISSHTFTVAQFFAENLSRLRHSNGVALAEVYSADGFHERAKQGPIVNFNLRRANGDYIGFAEVDKMVQLHDIHLRTGCFCNIGACQAFLNISSDSIKENLKAGHVCGDDVDLVNGHPTGSVRVSFGYMSSITDAVRCLSCLIDCFLDTAGAAKPVVPLPEWYGQQARSPDEGQRAGGDVVHASSMDAGRRRAQDDRSEVSSDVLLISRDLPEKSAPPEVQCSEKVRRLTDIFLYPVKSCGAFRVSEWPIGPRGLLYDRTWMVVSENGIALGQKREPRLCMLVPVVHLDTGKLELSFPGVESFFVDLDVWETEAVGDASICTNKICNDRVNTVDCGDAVAAWLCDTLERSELRLLRQLDEDRRQSKRKDVTTGVTEAESPASPGLSLANEAQFLLISRESVRSLQKKLTEAQEDDQREVKGQRPEGKQISEQSLVLRFRANLVTDGGLPFDEESWASVTCGDVPLVSQGKCSRCGMVCLDQRTGEKSSEPLRTLAAWRGGKVYFGVYLRFIKADVKQVLCVGSEIVLL